MSVPPFDLLWPGDAAGPVGDDEALERLYAYPDDGCWVRANMVSTLDGAAAGPDGRTASVNTEADRHVFALLRRLADVVLVGAGTVRAEGYGMPRHAALAVVTRTGRVPRTLLDGDTTAVVVTAESAGEEVLSGLRNRVGSQGLVVAGEKEVDLTAAIDTLQDRGFERVLCEGGPSLLSDLVRSGELDELCLTWSPLVTGGEAIRILDGGQVDVRFELGHLLHSRGTLLGRWVVSGST